VSFLARVKPEMLGISEEALRKWRMPEHSTAVNCEQGIIRPPTDLTCPVSGDADPKRQPLPAHPPALLVAALSILLAAGPAYAHRPQADFTVLPDRQVRIEGWFDPGADPMRRAKIQVFRPEKRLLVEGQLDDEGQFVFQFPEAEPLEVIVNAGAGHRTSFVIPREKLDQGHDAATSLDQRSAWRERFKDALLGVTFLLALGAFILGWRNARKLKSLPGGNSTGPDRAP
jgi:nickel transport protein